MPSLISGASHDVARGHASELLNRVGLAERLEHKPGELSGGEQQRVAVARALIQEPRVVLADEPTGNLDPATAAGVQDLLIELNAERRLTLVVVTHSAGLAAAMDRTLRLSAGRIAPDTARAVAVH
jgi:lipoprotein-releasing system ATP-binding protein